MGFSRETSSFTHPVAAESGAWVGRNWATELNHPPFCQPPAPTGGQLPRPLPATWPYPAQAGASCSSEQEGMDELGAGKMQAQKKVGQTCPCLVRSPPEEAVWQGPSPPRGGGSFQRRLAVESGYREDSMGVGLAGQGHNGDFRSIRGSLSRVLWCSPGLGGDQWGTPTTPLETMRANPGSRAGVRKARRLGWGTRHLLTKPQPHPALGRKRSFPQFRKILFA